MRVSKFLFPILIAFVLVTGCRKDLVQKNVYNNVVYEINPVNIYATSAEKNKQKSATQYASILYSDLFNQSISGNTLSRLNETTLSIGDKSVASSLILQKLLVQPGLQIPTSQQMRDNTSQFVSDTYVRFLQRYPTPYEAYYVKKFIDEDLSITPEIVYAAFIQSNEYFFY